MEDRKFEVLVKNFYTDLIENKQQYLDLFSRLQIQIEGWFRGELMNYFEKQKIPMSNKNREVQLNDGTKEKADLKIELNKELYWIEIKHILIGYQLKDSFSLGFYFSNGTYIHRDIEKLRNIGRSEEKQHGYSLAFISTNYSKEGPRESKIEKINTKDKLENMFEDIKKDPTHSDLLNSILHTSCEYDNETHFGYILLGVKVNNDP